MGDPAGRPHRPLAGKRVVLGVCGGIAAYKAVEVCRRLGDAGAIVSPVLTPSATRFVGPLTFSALAAEPARVSLFSSQEAGMGTPEGPGRGGAGPDDEGSEHGAAASTGTSAATGAGSFIPHVQLGRNADAVVVVPATARVIGSYAAGISSDLLTSILLATRAPVLLCPAMHTEMWEHPAIQDNLALLRRRGVHVLEPAEGRLAGGDFGKGRLREPEEVVAALEAVIAGQTGLAGQTGGGHQVASPAGALRGVKAVVSAGGTREPIDPVRYIGNRSSGKQGYAIASELQARGAEVVLVTSSPLAPPAKVEVVEVETAAEMAEAVLAEAAGADVVVMAAAVADYRPSAAAPAKLKKSGTPMTVELVPTLDILATLGARKRPAQVVVGFAAETASGDELVELGRGKLAAKRADLVVANDVGAENAGFGSDRSAAVIVSDGALTDLGVSDKRAVASKLVDAIADLLSAKGVLASRKGAK
ncbi:MAG TPA: bifunctional phosphopantothenoylcysteine decarboxylase/phosphopantothenate--cysteine ligase CoaBC [Acidimicrobiales bacterium]|nr:bifunctional phosphopantothenoylcysteine decarboxylase/phosphopantothenate--cysteine ligase CoaBC [Acidimicrobiales bacterium]